MPDVMPDPFVHPEEPTAAEAIAAIRDEFEFLDDDHMKFTQLIDYKKRLPAFPAAWQDDAHLVPGCLSKVWLRSEIQNGKLMLAGDSNSVLVAGLVAVLLRVYSGRSPVEVLATDPAFVGSFGVPELTSNRKNGVASMLRRIREVARASVPA